jgi:AsmA protein
MKKVLIAGASLLGVLVVVAIGLWLFFDANRFRPILEEKLSAALGRKVTAGHIRLALLSGGMSVDDLAIADDPAFSAQPFVTAKAVTVGVDLMPLLLSHSLRVESFRLEQPRVVLLRAGSGTWNFSRLGAASPGATGAASSSQTSGTAATSVVIQKISIAGGQVIVATAGTRKERVYDDVNVEVSDLSFTSRFPFRVTAKTPGRGTVKLDGQAGPLDLTNAAQTPFQATVDLQQLDVASTGFVDPASGLAGIVDFTGTLTSDGSVMSSQGKVNAAKIQLVAGAAPAKVPVKIDYASEYTMKTEHGVLKQGDVHVGTAVARLTGDYDIAGETPAVRMKLNGQKMPVTELEAALPAIGVTLPSGASLKQGTLDTDLAISGPIDRLVIAGPVALSNATMAGFDLGAKLAPIASLTGLPKSGQTVIQTLSLAVRMAAQGMQVDSLNLVVPSIGNLTGAGTVAPKGAMDFAMLAKLQGSGPIAGQVSRIASFGQAANGIPFRIQGTTSNPVFVPDARRAVTNVLKSEETKKKATDLLSGLFHKKKP